MNKEEIDKILSRLERIDHKEYSCSFEFADSGSFVETCRCFDERRELANYIKELQQENEKLKLNHKQLSDIEKMAICNSRLIQENKQLKERNNKAIEYLEQPPVILVNGEYRNIYAEDDNKLLEILKGDSNEKEN